MRVPYVLHSPVNPSNTLLLREVISINNAILSDLVIGCISIDKYRLSIFGAIQPGCFAEMLNSSSDDQGFWDRFLILSASQVSDISVWG